MNAENGPETALSFALFVSLRLQGDMEPEEM